MFAMAESLTPSELPSADERYSAVLFADISDSTRLYEVLGDKRALASINGALSVLRKLTKLNNGRLIKTIGDAIMASFPDAETAVQAASAMQMAISELPAVDNNHIAVRIGFHYGPVIETPEDGDIYGDTVNIAARMTSIGKAGQIVTSGQTAKMLSEKIRANSRSLHRLSVKGKLEDMEVFEILWQESSDMTMVLGPPRRPVESEAGLGLKLEGRDLIFDEKVQVITVGRDPGSDVVIRDRLASRSHARLEKRQGKYVYVDQSTNGSYIKVGDEPEIQLRREEYLLRSSGRIYFGHSASSGAGGEYLEFFCGPR
jgi:class 3 adenylate cyclase